MDEVFNLINIDHSSRVPKYKQVVDSIKVGISNGKLELNQRIPSINGLSEEFYLSRDTVEKAYKILKREKIITPIAGKGFYIVKTDLRINYKVFFVMNKLSTYKLHIYNSFIRSMGGEAEVNLQIYHCDEILFCNQIEKSLGQYDKYVIMPHFKNDEMKHLTASKKIIDTISRIQEDRVIIIDNKIQGYEAPVQIYQDFENDIYGALESFLDKIKNYNKIILVYPEETVYPYPRRILHGFRKFCVRYDMPFEIIDEIYDDMVLNNGDLFVVIDESALVDLMKQIRNKGMCLGEDIGIISYNDTPLKELLDISVITTDFAAMGRKTAEMILSNETGNVKNPFMSINRKSL